MAIPSFVDAATLTVAGGNGGHGCASIHREKFKPLGGPDGGNGGNGGSVILRVEPGLTTLVEYHRQSQRRAQNGQPGKGDRANGANGDALAREIRNALTDALGHGDNALLRSLAHPPPPAPDLAGRYRLDAQVPMEIRGAVADLLEDDTFEVQVNDDQLTWRLPEAASASALHPLAPNRYASASGSLRLLFHRGPDGRVQAVSVLHPASDARALYRRVPEVE